VAVRETRAGASRPSKASCGPRGCATICAEESREHAPSLDRPRGSAVRPFLRDARGANANGARMTSALVLFTQCVRANRDALAARVQSALESFASDWPTNFNVGDPCSCDLYDDATGNVTVDYYTGGVVQRQGTLKICEGSSSCGTQNGLLAWWCTKTKHGMAGPCIQAA